MKIKLEHLGLHDILSRKQETPNHKRIFSVAASIAAIILLFASLYSGSLINDQPMAVKVASVPTPEIRQPFYQLDFESFRKIKHSIESSDFILYTSELPGIKSFRALSLYLDWVFDYTQRELDKQPKISPELIKLQLNGRYSYKPNMLCCS